MTKFYDWQKTLSNDKGVTFAIGAHGAGREFGMRKHLLQCQEEHLRKELEEWQNSTTGTRHSHTTRT